jgi:hypothetical protein
VTRSNLNAGARTRTTSQELDAQLAHVRAAAVAEAGDAEGCLAAEQEEGRARGKEAAEQLRKVGV